MTPQFTTPCYIKIDDAQQRKEVCDKLYAIGYLLGQHSIDALDDTIITYPESSTFCTGSYGYYDEIDFKGYIKCDSIPCFLDLAGMRGDTSLNQWFVYRKKIYNYSDCDSRVKQKINSGFGRYATAEEIINYHKQKGEKE